MAIKSLIKLLFGFGFGVVFIVLSGLLTGGILFADFLLNLNLSDNFIVFGIPYGFIAGLVYLVFLKFRGAEEDVFKKVVFFGIGFWLSFSILYIIMYFAFSNFGF